MNLCTLKQNCVVYVWFLTFCAIFKLNTYICVYNNIILPKKKKLLTIVIYIKTKQKHLLMQ